jgi:branched-chain amino acid transport system substrate-binding protein
MRRTVLASVLLAASLPLAAKAQVSGDAAKIGVLTDMAGVTADITGKGSLVAAEMAVAEVGGTVLGKPVQVISADHQHKVDVGSAIAQRWIDVEGVDAIVDVPNSGVALPFRALRARRSGSCSIQARERPRSPTSSARRTACTGPSIPMRSRTERLQLS